MVLGFKVDLLAFNLIEFWQFCPNSLNYNASLSSSIIDMAPYLSPFFWFIIEGVTESVLILNFAMLQQGETFHCEDAVYFWGKSDKFTAVAIPH